MNESPNNGWHFAFLNAGHFLDHYFLLIFATVAALSLADAWHLSYAQLIPYATPGFVAFGLCALPAGVLADKWSREGMMLVFFTGIGISSMGCALAQTPGQLGGGLFAVGVFAAIYHPVGIAMVIEGRRQTGIALAVNGIFGNLGVACAALVTGFILDLSGWRAAFFVPGVVCVLVGLAYGVFLCARGRKPTPGDEFIGTANAGQSVGFDVPMRQVFAVMFLTTALGGLLFQSTTFSLPKLFDERLGDIASSATQIGGYAFFVFTIAAFGQLAVGYFLDRYPLRNVFMLVTAIQVALALAMHSAFGVPAVVVCVALMLVVFGQIPINDVLVGRITRSEWRSRVLACRYIVTFSVMAGTIPLVGWVHQNRGFGDLFFLLASAAFASFLATLFIPGRIRPLAHAKA